MSPRSSRLATCGMGCAMVERKTIASVSDSQIPAGSCVTASMMPSKPYAGSIITLIFLPTLRSSMWNMDSGNSCSGIVYSRNYSNVPSKDKTVSAQKRR